jgi:hypothetical protein
MGIKLGDISPLAGAISGKGLFGKGLGAMNNALGPMAGIMPRLAASAQKKNARRATAEEEIMAMRKADFDAKRNAAAGMETGMKKGGKVKKMAKGGSVSASRRGDGCATKGKTKGRFV